ncbi:MAG: Hpt domain-containing protein [Thiobacillaceae bacterium]
MHLDLNVLRGFVGNNNAIQQRILLKFGSLINDSRGKVVDAANNGTLDVVRSACHALKSSSRSVGAIELGRLSEQLEAIVAGRAPGPIEPVLAFFLEECSAVERELKETADATGQP